MTKKDFELIASVFREAKTFGNKNDGSLVFSCEIIDDMANALDEENPRFDYRRFVSACLGEDATDSAGRKVRYASR